LKKLVAYLTTGYPDINFTKDLISEISQYVDILELGVPFSDPVADGEIIEKANGLALKNGIKFQDVLNIAKTSKIDTFLMGYFNSFYNQNMDILIPKLKDFNINGLIVPDLPFEEIQKYRATFKRFSKEIIPFIAPTDNEKRVQTIVENDDSKFIYLVAYAGITGSGKSESLKKVIEDIRKYSRQNIFIGFGVNEKTAKEKVKNVDGVIVGTAFVKTLLNQDLTSSEKIKQIVQSAKNIKNIINE